jgi:hypothetical protein
MMTSQTAEIIELKKTCNNCGVLKSFAEFRKRTGSVESYPSRCLSCQAAMSKKWRENNPEKLRAQRERTYATGKKKRQERRSAQGLYAIGQKVTEEGVFCGSCKVRKSPEDFSKSSYTASGYYASCKICKRKSANAWLDRNREKSNARHRKHHRKNHLKQNYNLTIDDFNRLVQNQKGACAICLNKFAENKSGKPHVDHDHNTGIVRGILCGYCNSALGMFRDNEEVLRNAINYLLKSRMV